MPKLHIPFTDNKYIIFDEEDSSVIAKLKIFMGGTLEHESVMCSENSDRKPMITLGRYMLGLKIGDELECDHKDRNIFNFKRDNLRIATRMQQLANRGIYGNNTSGYKGVIWHKQNKCWRVRVNQNGITKYDQCFNNKETAARAYDKAAKRIFGEFAVLNFPEISDNAVN